MSNQEQGALRFKTEAEFIAEYGEDWKEIVKWAPGGGMDYLFGLPCEDRWLEATYYCVMHEDKANGGDPLWFVKEKMVTRAPLPEPDSVSDISQETGPQTAKKEKPKREKVWYNAKISTLHGITFAIVRAHDKQHAVRKLKKMGVLGTGINVKLKKI